jgi:hypothetical protein
MKKYFAGCAAAVLLLASGLNVAIAQGSDAVTGSKSAEKSVSVNELASNPSAYTGSVTLIGVVGTITPGKGFTLVDTREYRACGLSCLTEAGTKIIPVRWNGTPPAVEQTVTIEGELRRENKGFTFVARKIDKR